MSFEIFTVTIAYPDGSTEQVRASRQHVADGVLHLFYKGGPGIAVEDHVGSWSLAAIRSWRRNPA